MGRGRDLERDPERELQRGHDGDGRLPEMKTVRGIKER